MNSLSFAQRTTLALLVLGTLSACGGSSGGTTADTTLPVITFAVEGDLTHEAKTEYVDEGVSALDNVDGELTVEQTGSVDIDSVGSNELTYTATDAAGNVATASRIVNVVDTVAPVISLSDEVITLEAGIAYEDGDVDALDNVDGELDVVQTGSVDINSVGSHTLTYTATDASGNSSTATRTVNVVDTTDPVITLVGGNITHEVNTAYVDAGWTTSDNSSGTVTVIQTGSVTTDTFGTYTLTYTATDTTGNESSVTRTVDVEDSIGPVVTLNGGNLTLEVNSEYVEEGASALDNFDGTVVVIQTGTVTTDTLGTYTLTYTATDTTGNESSVTRTVKIEDTIAPVITIIEETLTHEANTAYVDEGVSALDSFNGELTVIQTGSVDITRVGSNTLEYTATDTSGNVARASRTVNVIDTVAPVISFVTEGEITHEVKIEYVDEGVSVVDAVDETVTLTQTGNVNIDTLGTYTLDYTATDASGNVTTASRTVNVVDTTPPVITIIGETDIKHSFEVLYVDQGATVTDNFDATVTLIISGADAIDETLFDSSYTVTYSATDSAGNNTTKTRSVLVTDTTPPVITLNQGKDGLTTVILGEGRDYRELGATALDDIDETAPVVTVVASDVIEDTIGEYTVTYNATDEAGNIGVATRNISVVASRPFITTWKTDNTGFSEDDQIQISTNPDFAGSYNYSVDWGDGVEDTAIYTGDTTHTYTEAGTYTVTINGDFPQLYLSYPTEGYDATKLLTVEQWGDIALLSLEDSFYNAVNLTSDAVDTPDLRQVESLRYAFGNTSHFNADISDWDVSNVKKMISLFSGSSFNGDLSQWDVSNVDSMISLFLGSSFNGDLSQWDVSSVTDMAYIFRNTTAFNQDISMWDTSSLRGLQGAFTGASSFDQDLSNWNVESVNDFADIFKNMALSTENYDAILNSWSQQVSRTEEEFDGGCNEYSSAAQEAHDYLTQDLAWIITYTCDE